MNLILIRHGESEWNRLNKFTGWVDVDLSKNGVLEAKNCGKILTQNKFEFDICYTSFLKRAINTLHIILDTLDMLWLPVKKSPKLNERHYGALQGLNKTATAEKYGAEQVKIWRRSFNIRPPALPSGNNDEPQNNLPYTKYHEEIPACESLEDVLVRVRDYFETEIKPQILDSKKVLIVAHGNTIRALAKHLEDMQEKELINLEIPTAKPLIYEFDTKFCITKKYFLESNS